MAPLGKRNYDT
uniref:Uncharacterized protein n=1 Tax=Rhizophora mucronata TaxID=61149 RepID=A0A2P2IKB7_RHIMU